MHVKGLTLASSATLCESYWLRWYWNHAQRYLFVFYPYDRWPETPAKTSNQGHDWRLYVHTMHKDMGRAASNGSWCNQTKKVCTSQLWADLMAYICRYRCGGVTAYERGVGHKKEVIKGLGPEDGDGKCWRQTQTQLTSFSDATKFILFRTIVSRFRHVLKMGEIPFRSKCWWKDLFFSLNRRARPRWILESGWTEAGYNEDGFF